MSNSSLLLKDFVRIIRREDCGIYDHTAQDMLAQKIYNFDKYLDKLTTIPEYSVDQYTQAMKSAQYQLDSETTHNQTNINQIFDNMQYWFDNIKHEGISECLYDMLCDRLLHEIVIETSLQNRSPLQPYDEWIKWVKQDTLNQISKMKTELDLMKHIYCNVHTPSSDKLLSLLKKENENV